LIPRYLDSQRLAYISETTVNWCPKLGTVLANDEVIDGRSERGGFPVLRKPLRQWMFRITAYAERLLAQLKDLDWPASTKAMQEDWIGKSSGAEIEFPVVGRLSEPTPTTPTHFLHAWDEPGMPSVRDSGFKACDPFPIGEPPPGDLLVEARKLPHVMLPGATYFVTLRTKGWNLDDASKDIVMRSLMHFDGERCEVLGACVMSNHVHWIVRPRDGYELRELVASVKRFSATEINRHESMTGPLWDEDAFDHIIRDGRWLSAFLAYVARNPIEAGMASRVRGYAWTYISRELTLSAGLPEAGSSVGIGDRWARRGGVAHEGVGSERRPTSTLRVFTTRPDTIFGATYMVVAPEHELCEHIAQGRLGVGDANRYQLRQYCEAARNRSDVERQESKEKTGVFTGVYAINPATGAPIPVWAADYVLAGYGTGAIMAVPAHDDRDFAFAKAFDLPIVDVVYTRAELAMAFFVRNSIADEQTDERFADVLADFLGLVTSTQADPDKFDQLMSVIRTRRVPPAAGGTSVPIHLADPPSGRPASIGERRGVTKIVWLDALEDLGFTSFDVVRETFEARTFHARRGEAWTGPGFAVNSSNDRVSIDGLHAEEAKARVGDWLEASGLGRRKTNYKLRDWTFSRQRYWGEPFPIVYDKDGHAYPVRESALPVKLPELADYAPVESENPQPLLAKAAAWMNTTAGAAGVDPALLPPETPVTRETNTMPGSAGSSWYAVRYTDPRCAVGVAGREAEGYWIKDGVDLYIGGSEHAVGHLLYSRFWHNVLFDLGALSGREPFRKLVHQGLITSYAFQRPDKTIVAVDEVREVVDGDKTTHVEIATGKPVSPIVTKMSKRYKNVINPDDVIGEFGADTCRLYEMYMGPLEASKPWNPRDIAGCFRFLQRAWRLCVDEKTGALRSLAARNHDIEKQLHRLIAKAEGDIERLSFNTAIAAMMELVNAATTAGGLEVSQIQRFALVLAPFAPHLAEEIFARAGGTGLASEAAWPTFDPALLVDASIEMPVQIMGKVRTRIQVPRDADQAAVEAAVLSDAKVQEQIGGKAIKKVIVVPGKLVNLVLG
jgi:leucyl-tRNA synthetase/REP element-mobilizing transposase RayT